MKGNNSSNVYAQLTLAMVKTGILGFGGGPSVVPLIRHEAVKAYGWLSDDEFGEIFVLANTLPGPIATKMAGYLGYRLKGAFGACIAVIAHILPSSIAMIFLMSMVSYFSTSAVVQGMISAVVPVVAVMLGLMAYEFAEKAVKGLGLYIGIMFFVIALLMLQVISIHPAVVIIVFIAYGSVHYRVVDSLKARRAKKGGQQ